MKIKLEPFPYYENPPMKFYFPGWAAFERGLWWVLVFLGLGFGFTVVIGGLAWAAFACIGDVLLLVAYDLLMEKRHPRD